MQRLVNHLRSRGAPGSIVNILSIHAHGGSPPLAVYASTKAALAGLTRNTAHAHRFDRIRVNGINVGWVDTPAERQMQAVTLGLGEDGSPKRRPGSRPAVCLSLTTSLALQSSCSETLRGR